MTALDPTDREFFRRYDPAVDEFDAHGYPRAWTRLTETELPTAPSIRLLNGGPVRMGIKDVVRLLADQRCIRCNHPYVVGESGEWGEVPAPEQPDDMPTLFDGMEGSEFAALALTAATDGIQTKKLRAPLWSPCDERCRHSYVDERGRTTGRWLSSEGWLDIDDEGAARAMIYDHGATVQAAWRILTVHHLTGEKADCRWWNLTSLCQRCHLQIQRQVVMDRPWLSEHDEWFKPYAAGWYAWKYEGLELSRSQVMERLDELLAHERVI